MNIDPRLGNNFLDANALQNSGSPADTAAMEEILRLAETSEITLLLPYSVKDELADPNTPQEVKSKSMFLLFSVPLTLTAPERATHQKLRALIQGNAQSGQHDKDAFHIVESAKNGGRHFITKDKRLLKKAPEIWEALQIRILTPSDFIADYYPNQRTS